jgi:hypothetical protein
MPAMKDTTISFKIERSLKAKLSALARDENRSVSNLILTILKEKLSEHESKRGRPKNDD